MAIPQFEGVYKEESFCVRGNWRNARGPFCRDLFHVHRNEVAIARYMRRPHKSPLARLGGLFGKPAWAETQPKSFNVSATHEVRYPRRDEVDRYWRRQLTGLPFRARQSSRNGPVRLGQRFSEDRRRALPVEGGDAMHLRPPPAAQPLPSERKHLRTPTRLEP